MRNNYIKMNCDCGYSTEKFSFGTWTRNGIEHCDILFYCDNCSQVMLRDVLRGNGLKKYNLCPFCRKKVYTYVRIVNKNQVLPMGVELEFKIGNSHKYYIRNVSHHCPKCKTTFLKLWTLGYSTYE